jgi:hypothetical protein
LQGKVPVRILKGKKAGDEALSRLPQVTFLARGGVALNL